MSQPRSSTSIASWPLARAEDAAQDPQAGLGVHLDLAARDLPVDRAPQAIGDLGAGHRAPVGGHQPQLDLGVAAADLGGDQVDLPGGSACAHLLPRSRRRSRAPPPCWCPGPSPARRRSRRRRSGAPAPPGSAARAAARPPPAAPVTANTARRWASAWRRRRPYQRSSRVIRPHAGAVQRLRPPAGPGLRNMRAASTGTTVKPTTSEQTWQNTTTRASDWNSAPLIDCMNTSGQEHHAGGERRGQHRARPPRGRRPPPPRRAAAVLLAFAHDVLEHDDGVVDHHAHPEGQPAEGHLVEGQAAEVQQREAGDDRDRDRHPDDGGAGPAAQEQVQDAPAPAASPTARSSCTLSIDWRMNSL